MWYFRTSEETTTLFAISLYRKYHVFISNYIEQIVLSKPSTMNMFWHNWSDHISNCFYSIRRRLEEDEKKKRKERDCQQWEKASEL